jgi:hypothetical protein
MLLDNNTKLFKINYEKLQVFIQDAGKMREDLAATA